jgi:hypothetical protein
MSGPAAISTHSVEALSVGVASAPAASYLCVPDPISSGELDVKFFTGFGFQSAQGIGGVPAVQQTDLSERELEAEFSALADDALDWAHLVAGAVPESWPDE